MKNQNKFTTTVHVTFGDCDPAGILYFARIFEFSHQVFEEFIEASGIGWANWFRKGPYFVPLKHVESDYTKPLLPGRYYQVIAEVSRLGDSSFQMQYSFLGSASGAPAEKSFTEDAPIHAVVKMVHVFADANTKKKCPIPEDVRSALQRFLADPNPA